MIEEKFLLWSEIGLFASFAMCLCKKKKLQKRSKPWATKFKNSNSIKSFRIPVLLCTVQYSTHTMSQFERYPCREGIVNWDWIIVVFSFIAYTCTAHNTWLLFALKFVFQLIGCVRFLHVQNMFCCVCKDQTDISTHKHGYT